jgi:hypothetical protein
VDMGILVNADAGPQCTQMAVSNPVAGTPKPKLACLLLLYLCADVPLVSFLPAPWWAFQEGMQAASGPQHTAPHQLHLLEADMLHLWATTFWALPMPTSNSSHIQMSPSIF